MYISHWEEIKNGKLRKYINTLIVFLLSGLWHGANWTFVIWGGINGIYQILGDILSPTLNKVANLFKINKELFCNKLVKVFTTFCLINFSFIFFRAKDLKVALYIIGRIFTSNDYMNLINGALLKCNLDGKDFVLLFISILILLATDILKYKKKDIVNSIEKQSFWFRWIIYLTLIFCILVFGIWGSEFSAKSFIYFQF